MLLPLMSCHKDEDPTRTNPDTSFYFPPNSGTEWEKSSVKQLGWDSNAIRDLKIFLAQKNTKSFMILVNGRIVMEEYFNGHTSS